MKKNLTILLAIFLMGVVHAEAGDKVIKADRVKAEPTPLLTIEEDTDLFFEDWEAGLGGWTTFDETGIAPQWHLDTWMAYGGSGESWWMADVTLGTDGGYNNGWYQVLDTDEFTLAGANQQLTFYHRYSVEGPAGATTPYTGWDGMNVRISTDGGSTWEVLANPTPAYTATSLYSFGFEHGEGPNVPGWAGDLLTWTQVTFDLTAYSGQAVKIRFAFASDPAYSTGQDDGPATMFAWQIDDVLVTNDGGTIYSNDGAASGMTASNNAALGADLWTVRTGNAFSGTHFADCNNASGTYEPNMQNSLTSPWFNLPSVISTAYMDFYLRGSFVDNNTFPDVDYFGAYVQVEGEAGRRYVSNITQDPNGSNFVYSDAPFEWSPFSTTYSVGVIDLSTLIGNNIRVIIEFESDDDAPIGEGLQVDDVMIWTPDVVPVELTSFTAVQQGAYVNLEWNTATELNNHGFEIERKTVSNGVESDWRMVAFKKGNGTMSEPTAYTLQDKIEGIAADQIMYRLKQIDFNGNFEYSESVLVDNIAPLEYAVSQNYPNPFNPATIISYAVPSQNYVSLKVFNVTGEEIATLVNGVKEAGTYEVSFNATEMPSGVYFYVFKAGDTENSSSVLATKKMMLLK
jgi:hypothetical protein